MYLAQLPDPSPTIKALNDAGVSGVLLVTVIALVVVSVVSFLIARLIYRQKGAETGNKKAEIDQGTAALTALSSSITTLTSIAATLANNQTTFQVSDRDNKLAIQDLKRVNDDVVKSNLQVVDIVQDLKDATLTGTGEIRQGFKDIVAHNERIADNYVATTRDLADISSQNGKEILERLDASTQSVIESVFKVPQTTSDPILQALKDMKTVIDRIDVNVSPSTLKAELDESVAALNKLKDDFDKAFQYYLKASAQSDKDQDAADKTIDKQARQHIIDTAALADALTKNDPLTLPLIDPGELNREAIDKVRK